MRKVVAIVAMLLAVLAGYQIWGTAPPLAERIGIPMGEKVVKSDDEWRKELTPEQFRVTRKKGTERAFSGEYANTKSEGVFQCVCCGQPLFDSKTKYESGTGWPSFWKPVDDNAVSLHNDRGFLMTRTEVVCSRCDAHLGHVFKDGPAPTGLRYCMNSASLKLNERKPDKNSGGTP